MQMSDLDRLSMSEWIQGQIRREHNRRKLR
jgi:hypothetical protein